MIKPIIFAIALVGLLFSYQNCTAEIIQTGETEYASNAPFTLSSACIKDSKAITLTASLSQNFSLQCKRMVPILDDQYFDCGGIALDSEGASSYYIDDDSILFNNLTQDHYHFFIRTVHIVDGKKQFGQDYEVNLQKCN